MGMENGQIRDSQITASSRSNTAAMGRLNFKAGGGKEGAWGPSPYSVYSQWLQVDLDRYTVVTGIATQGRNDANQWVTSYILQYSEDGVTIVNYKEQGESSAKVSNA